MYNVEYDNGDKEYKVIVSRINIIEKFETEKSQIVATKAVNGNGHSSNGASGLKAAELRMSELSIKCKLGTLP